jgi:hypothetical protein
MPLPRADTVRYLITIASAAAMADTVAVEVSCRHHMKIQRVTSLLQGIASARSWLIKHIPLTSSMAGYDLFLKIANDAMAGRPIVIETLLAGLRHPQRVVLYQLKKMEVAGLIAEPAAALAPQQANFVPTPKFLELLQNFSKEFESLFILRKNLRDEQLVVVTTDDALRDFAESLYDHFYDLGWFYLHNFGAACFLMSSLVTRVAIGYGYRARVASCYAEIAKGEGCYKLGAEGFAKPGQIDGHAVCILEETMMIDFGLGNVRRGYRRDFPWAIACEYRPQGAMMGGIALPSGETVVWKDDWQSPGSAEELARYAPHLDQLHQQYESYFR